MEYNLHKFLISMLHIWNIIYKSIIPVIIYIVLFFIYRVLNIYIHIHIYVYPTIKNYLLPSNQFKQISNFQLLGGYWVTWLQTTLGTFRVVWPYTESWLQRLLHLFDCELSSMWLQPWTSLSPGSLHLAGR